MNEIMLKESKIKKIYNIYVNSNIYHKKMIINFIIIIYSIIIK